MLDYHPACQHLHQGGLSASVGADDTHTVIFQENVGEILHQHLVPVSLAQILHLHRGPA